MSPLLTVTVLIVSALYGHQAYSFFLARVWTLRGRVITFFMSVLAFGVFFGLSRMDFIVFLGFLGMWVTMIMSWSALIGVVHRVSSEALQEHKTYSRFLWFMAAFFWPFAIFLYLFIRDNVVT